VYQRQEALIIWSEGDNYEQILSFEEKADCDEIWETICQVQGKDSVDITRDFVGESDDEYSFEDNGQEEDDFEAPVELPPCELNKLEAINRVYNQLYFL